MDLAISSLGIPDGVVGWNILQKAKPASFTAFVNDPVLKQPSAAEGSSRVKSCMILAAVAAWSAAKRASACRSSLPMSTAPLIFKSYLRADHTSCTCYRDDCRMSRINMCSVPHWSVQPLLDRNQLSGARPGPADFAKSERQARLAKTDGSSLFHINCLVTPGPARGSTRPHPP